MAEAGLRLDLGEEVATITLDRPERLNAQTPRMWLLLAEIGRALVGTVRVVVVRGSGRAFSAGLDRAYLTGAVGPGAVGPGELARMPAERAEAVIESYQRGFGWLRRTDLVSIAAVQGHAIGAGFQLALACDLRILADDARLQMAEGSLGLVPDLGGTKPLVDTVGYARALEICLSGRRVEAAEAERIGLANLVVPAAELAAATSDLVATVLAAPRGAVAEIKALLAGAGGRSRSEQEAAERAAQRRRLADLAGLAED
ncbi:MAG: enoyl-CoA hydratase/isomerase family protein [Actinobacteria bacterium]|nr:enoyl-CoA hydratase/isomerase family protein [Actinomycetota bacterium]